MIAHDLKCGTCGAAATHEQCGGALACDAHIGPGRAWLIDAKTIELLYRNANLARQCIDTIKSTTQRNAKRLRRERGRG